MESAKASKQCIAIVPQESLTTIQAVFVLKTNTTARLGQ